MHIKSIVSDEDREELERMLSLGFIIPNQLFKTRQKSRMIIYIFTPVEFLLSINCYLSESYLMFGIGIGTCVACVAWIIWYQMIGKNFEKNVHEFVWGRSGYETVDIDENAIKIDEDQIYEFKNIDRMFLYKNFFFFITNEKKIFIDQEDNIFDYKMYIQELELALELAKMLKGMRSIEKKIQQFTNAEINRQYEWIKNRSHIEYSSEQEQAILSAFTEPVIIITGGPGTGKTTIVKAIIEMYFKLNQDNQTIKDYIALLAPTGKAAKRLKESTNMQTMTIHKFLGYIGNCLLYTSPSPRDA